MYNKKIKSIFFFIIINISEFWLKLKEMSATRTPERSHNLCKKQWAGWSVRITTIVWMPLHWPSSVWPVEAARPLPLTMQNGWQPTKSGTDN